MPCLVFCLDKAPSQSYLHLSQPIFSSQLTCPHQLQHTTKCVKYLLSPGFHTNVPYKNNSTSTVTSLCFWRLLTMRDIIFRSPPLPSFPRPPCRPSRDERRRDLGSPRPIDKWLATSITQTVPQCTLAPIETAANSVLCTIRKVCIKVCGYSFATVNDFNLHITLRAPTLTLGLSIQTSISCTFQQSPPTKISLYFSVQVQLPSSTILSAIQLITMLLTGCLGASQRRRSTSREPLSLKSLQVWQ